MATVTKGKTFISGETVEPADLHQLVDSATVTNIANADIADDTITNAKIKSDAAIALSKLATGALPTAITVASANLVDGTIVNADISASAAIAGSKLADAGITAAKLDGAQTGSAPIYGCRAWVNFDGSRNEADTGASTNGANVKIRASGNVASVLKNGTGDYTVNFTTAMQDGNYCAVCTASAAFSSSVNVAMGVLSYQAGSVRILAENANGLNTESPNTNVAIFR